MAVLAFDDAGAGPVVVLVHGHPFDRTMWEPQVPPLVAAGFRVLRPDLRGYGASPRTSGSVTMGELADDVRELLDGLGVARAAVVGLSMGGLIAMEWAGRYADRLWAAGFVATTAQPVTDEERAQRSSLAGAAESRGMEALVEAMAPRLFGPRCPPEVRRRIERIMRASDPASAAAALRGRAERPDYRPWLEALRVPTFVCVGTADGYSTEEVTAELVSCLHEPETLVLDGVAHLPNLEAPGAFDEALVAFLRRAAAGMRADGG